jgi:hypothetical protein
MSAFLRPLHLLLFGEAPADDEIDGESNRNRGMLVVWAGEDG